MKSVECNLVAYESTLLFEECFESANYEDDFWFAGYCLGTSFSPTPEGLFMDDPEVIKDIADYEMQCELISCCSYQSQYNKATLGLYHDLSI